MPLGVTTELLERAKGGDQQAWTDLVRANAGLVFAVARRHRLPEAECEDVAQVVFAALARHLHSMREAEALPAWLVTSAKRECWKALKRRRAESPGEVDPAAAPNEGDLERLERHARLRAALDEVGERCAALLRLLYLTSPPPAYEQVSAALEMPIGSIGPTRQRCLARLATMLGDTLGESVD